MKSIRSTAALVAVLVVALGSVASLGACSDVADGPGTSDGGVRAEVDAGATPVDAASTFRSGAVLEIPVGESGRTYVSLDPLAVVPAPSSPASSQGWDLAFEGYDVYTNGGVSGSGSAKSFGPLDAIAYVGETAPPVPFLSEDKAAGAFLDWYKYAGAPSHALYSRFHVVGVRDGESLWKVQILGYYGVRDGAPVSALYRLRYQQLEPSVMPVREVVDLDGTAGGPSGSPSAPAECLDLGSAKRTLLTPEAARKSSEWHLCFRRDNVTVNGEVGGPRHVGAFDLSGDDTENEALEDVEKRTPESESFRFEAVTAASFAGKVFRGDRVVSGFGDAWVTRSLPEAPATPAYATWVVVPASGAPKYVLGFSEFKGATSKSPGTVVMHRKPVGD